MVLIFCLPVPRATAAGLFGPPQTISRQDGGLNTAIGYRYHEDTYKNGADHTFRLNELYSQAAYGSKNIWEIYARVGMANMKIFDVFSSADASTVTDKKDFEDNWDIFGTLGAKVFYPVNSVFGIGAFVQGSYYFSSYTDEVTGLSGITPFRAELKVKNLWDAHFGIGLQATLPRQIKLYAGPYVYYSAADIVLTSGLEDWTGYFSVKNKSVAGGFAGLDIPLAKGFHLNIEGQFSDRFSAGAAISYTY